MIPGPVVDTRWLRAHIDDPRLLLVDCRFDLADAGAGRRAHEAGHLRGAVFADLNTDLSDLSKTHLGRHPLPDLPAFAATLARLGYRPDRTIVAYDQANGMFAARLWWMLRWVGHSEVAVLDGGFEAGRADGLPIEAGAVAPVAALVPSLVADPGPLADFDDVESARQDPARLLVDARAPERFRGEVEPIDPVAGHIPGAINRPFALNLGPDQRFRPAETLRSEFLALLDGRPASAVIHQCGSGVTACHNLLAMEHAGLPGARLFAPSWSGWIADRTRPTTR